MSQPIRMHPRLSIRARADVIGAEVVLGKPLDDISLGGCRLPGPAWEEAGATIHLVISFRNSENDLRLTGSVVRASERDMGVRFVDMSDEQKWSLRKEIREGQPV